MPSSRALLTCAAIGTVAGMLVVGLSPITGMLALVSPPAYALVASLHMLGPLTAAAWLRMPGAAALTALVAGLIGAALTPLGPLLVLALLVPAAAMDLVLLAARGRRDSLIAWVIAAIVGAAVLCVITVPVIDDAARTPLLVTLVVVARFVAVPAVAMLARLLARRLARTGLRPPRAS